MSESEKVSLLSVDFIGGTGKVTTTTAKRITLCELLEDRLTRWSIPAFRALSLKNGLDRHKTYCMPSGYYDQLLQQELA